MATLPGRCARRNLIVNDEECQACFEELLLVARPSRGKKRTPEHERLWLQIAPQGEPRRTHCVEAHVRAAALGLIRSDAQEPALDTPWQDLGDDVKRVMLKSVVDHLDEDDLDLIYQQYGYMIEMPGSPCRKVVT